MDQGITWYTWLEQGREVNASSEVLTALADALQLDTPERQYLFLLADRPPPDLRDSGPETVDGALKRLLESFTLQARTSLAMFRAATVGYAVAEDFHRLIARIMAQSPEFRAWWPRQEVSTGPGLKRIRHPQQGLMAFESSSFAVNDRRDLKLVVYTPLAEHETASKLRTLLG